MNFLAVNFENEHSILHSFDRIADKISKDIILRVNKSDYRICDFEFYCYGEKFEDHYTHKNDLQLKLGKIYLHGSGMDITFGDGKYYGGILVRGIIKLYDGADSEEGHMKKQFDGPQKSATEIFTGLHSLVDPEGVNNIELVDISNYHSDSFFHPPVTILKTRRVGLTQKKKDEEDKYLNIPLRYIVILKKFPNFKQTLKGLENIIGEHLKGGKLTPAEAENILGYKRNF